MRNSFNDLKTQLSEQDVELITALVCYRCRAVTYNKVRSRLTYHPSSVPDYGILGRLVKVRDGHWDYIAGQSYPDELRTIREIFVNDFKQWRK